MQFEETTGLSDQEFMTWLYETYAPLLWGTVKRYCRKQALREEIIQEGMVHLLACVPRLRGLQKDKLPGYLAVTVRNTTYNLVKSIIQSPFPGGSWAAYGKHPARAFPLTAPTPKDVPLIRTLFRY